MDRSEKGKTTRTMIMVLTRDLGINDSVGRLNTIRATVGVLQEQYRTEFFNLRSMVEERLYFRLFSRFLFNLFDRNKRLPIQCVLFANRKRIRQLLDEIGHQAPDAVYFDTIRCAAAVFAVRKRYPQLHILCDFDDLMSRRFRLLRESRHGISLGYLASFLNPRLRRLIESPQVATFLASWEEPRLRQVEAHVNAVAQCVVLVSQEDAKIHMQACGEANRGAQIITIPPLFTIVRSLQAPQPPLRFVFVGSDRLLQNRLTLEWLLALWEQQKIEYPLHIFGQQRGTYPSISHVTMEGYAESLDRVYTPQSILLAPSFVGGGVKTKIREALSYGVIPLGTPTSFEGMGIGDNPLAIGEEELRSIPARIEHLLPQLTAAASAIQARLGLNQGREELRKRWFRAAGSSL